MTKKATLLTFVGLVAVFALAVDQTAAQNREARPGQQRRVRNGNPVKVGGVDCAGATSANPMSGNMFNFADSDNSCSATNKISDYNNFGTGGPCNTVHYPGPELIYTFNLSGTPNSPSITLTQTAPTDMGVFVVSDCPNGLSCVDFEDQIGGGAVSNVTLSDATPGQYWVYVDSYYTSGVESCGNYTLTVTGVVPVELMDFKVE